MMSTIAVSIPTHSPCVSSEVPKASAEPRGRPTRQKAQKLIAAKTVMLPPMPMATCWLQPGAAPASTAAPESGTREWSDAEAKFEEGMRQNALEYMAADEDESGSLDFAEFVALVREMEAGEHSTRELRKKEMQLRQAGESGAAVAAELVEMEKEADKAARAYKTELARVRKARVARQKAKKAELRAQAAADVADEMSSHQLVLRRSAVTRSSVAATPWDKPRRLQASGNTVGHNLDSAPATVAISGFNCHPNAIRDMALDPAPIRARPHYVSADGSQHLYYSDQVMGGSWLVDNDTTESTLCFRGS